MQSVFDKNSFQSFTREKVVFKAEAEIEQMITRDVVPFIYKINRNKEQANKLEIILTIGKDTIRVPSDDVNDWLTING